MYAGFFGLQQAPFSIAPNPRYLYLSERHREALAHLLFGVEGGGGFVVLTGEIGAGKTTVCRHFLANAPASCRVAYIFNPRLTVPDLLATICQEFGVAAAPTALPHAPDSIKGWLDALNDHLLAMHASGANSVLVIDEAQNLPAEVLEQLRLLTNLETNERKLLQIVLIGQPELRSLLARPELEQLAQRVIARYHLGALTPAETRQYIEHRLRVAGLTGALPFSGEALERVHRLSRGIPRRINLLCDRALLGAYAQQQDQVSAATVSRAADEVFDAEPAPASPPSARRARTGWVVVAAGAVLGVGLGVLVGRWSGGLPLTSPSTEAPAPDLPQPATAQAESLALRPEPPPTTGAPPLPTPEAVQLPQATPVTGAPDWLQLHTGERDAMSELATTWALAPLADEPCASALRQQHQCYRMPRMTLNGIQALDRPAVLRLHPPGAPAGFAVLTHWQGETVTLSAKGSSWVVSEAVLRDVWRGEYASYWRTPVPPERHISSGTDPQVLPWLEGALGRLQDAGAFPRTPGPTQNRIQAFQRTQGLEPNGSSSPTTLIMLNRALGVPEPRLRSGGSAAAESAS